MDIENLKEQIAALPSEKQQVVQKIVSYLSESPYLQEFPKSIRYRNLDLLTNYLKKLPPFIQERLIELLLFPLFDRDFYGEYLYEYLLYEFMQVSRSSDKIRAETISPRPLVFEDQPFVGIWEDRKDMVDSTQWVRNIRQQQWQCRDE